MALPSDAARAALPGPTVASYFEAFSPEPRWEDLVDWPPDVFALTNLVLDHTEAYRFAVAPPLGRRWPPSPDWEKRVLAGAGRWREVAGHRGCAPEPVRAEWDRLVRGLGVPLAAIRGGEDAGIWESLLTLHAMSDQACQRLATSAPDARPNAFEEAAWSRLGRHGTVSRIDPARVRITPKTHFADRGITIRSLSRYLALSYESIDVRWRRVPATPEMAGGADELNLVMVPWPLEVRAAAFRPVEGPLENMDPSAFGFFRFEPDAPLDTRLLQRLVEDALRRAPRVDALVLPEAAVAANAVAEIEEVAGRLGVGSVIAGVRGPAGDNGLGKNYVHLALRDGRGGWVRFRQPKHHRWCLDASQLRQYHLTRTLDPGRRWWEAIELPPRTVEIIDLGSGATTAPLVCEDLARMDEVADVLRRIGPTLVVALLLDGPQLPQRWPCRYATVLADEPGSAVMTLTSLGMALRSQPPGMQRSRVVAMWSDPAAGLRQISLERGASAILLRAGVELKTVWTADGRRHERSTPSVSLAGVHQLRG
jgi:hypothetical protein